MVLNALNRAVGDMVRIVVFCWFLKEKCLKKKVTESH